MKKLVTEWTRALRYQPYDTWGAEYREALKQSVEESAWRLGYHIQPETGLLNDPNGFSYFNGKWQLFYQAYPFGGVHGLKSWAHMTSTDLVHWDYQGIALEPSTENDSHGVYSGSALPIADKLFLFYTGNVRDQNWERQSYQNGAWLDSAGVLTKELNPLVPVDPAYTDDFRDPMIFPYQGGYVMLIGAKDLEGQGKILTYVAVDQDVHHFEKRGELTFTQQSLGYMVECPNLVFIDEQPVLLFCPQGLAQSVKAYDNIFPNMYVVATSFDLERNELIGASPFKNLDEGFDVYATQAFNAPDGRALAVSWIGLPDIAYPTDDEGWANCLSLVKELTLKEGQLYQYPVAETLALRQSFQELGNGPTKLASKAFELAVTVQAGEIGVVNLFADEQNTKGLLLTIDAKHGRITLDRTKAGVPFAEAFGTVRKAQVAAEKSLSVTVFADNSVVEVYVNQGERTLTGRFFPDQEQSYLQLQGVTKGTLYPLETPNK